MTGGWVTDSSAVAGFVNVWCVWLTCEMCILQSSDSRSAPVCVTPICTASWTFSNSTFCPHSVFICFVWIWEQTAIISVNSINSFFFVMRFVLKKVAYTCSWMHLNVRLSKTNVTACYATRPETRSSTAVRTSNLEYLICFTCPDICCHFLRTTKQHDCSYSSQVEARWVLCTCSSTAQWSNLLCLHTFSNFLNILDDSHPLINGFHAAWSLRSCSFRSYPYSLHSFEPEPPLWC